MKITPTPAGRDVARGPRWWLLGSVCELWWNLDRRRHIARLGRSDRLHPLDEPSVVDAMARQLEEIRNLPEVAQ